MSLLGEPLVLLLAMIVAVSILYYYRSAILGHRRGTDTISRGGELKSLPIRSRTSVECPKCGRYMEEGYLLGPGGLFWSIMRPMYHDMDGLMFRRVLGSPIGAEPLDSSVYGSFSRLPNLRAYRCQNCSIVQMDLHNQETGD
jgi:hypothetical protein